MPSPFIFRVHEDGYPVGTRASTRTLREMGPELPQNREMYKTLLDRHELDQPKGEAPGKSPAYGSVGVDGKWPSR